MLKNNLKLKILDNLSENGEDLVINEDSIEIS